MSYRNAKTIDKQLRASLNKAVGDAIRKGVNQKYVEDLRDRVVKRTQLGVGVDPQTGNSIKLPPLSQEYKDQRSGKSRWYTAKSGKKIKVTKAQDKTGQFVKKPNLASTTTPAKSNVTATGQLLKALTVVKVKLTGGVAFFIRVGDQRGRGLFGYPANIGNKELVKILASKGRTFLGFTKSQKNQITREIRQIIIKYLR